jgi:predicted CopG family antitoxin
MTNRKNLKITHDTYHILKDEKRQMETWDSLLRRLTKEAQADE